MKIDFLPGLGTIQYQAPGVAKILNDEYKNSAGRTINRVDVSRESQFLQDICAAVRAIPETRETTLHNKMTFNTDNVLVRVDGRILTPASDISGEAEEVRAFCDAVFTDENKAVYDDNKPPPEPEYEMVSNSVQRVEYRDGKPTLIRKNISVPRTMLVRVQNEDGSPAFDDGNKPLFVDEKILKTA